MVSFRLRPYYSQGNSALYSFIGAQFVEALHYKSEGRGFDSRWYHWNFSLT